MPEHRGTGRARYDEGGVSVFEGEHLCGVLRDLSGFVPAAGIERRLAATGLVGPELDFAAGELEAIDGGQADLSIKGVAQTGEEEVYLHGLSPWLIDIDLGAGVNDTREVPEGQLPARDELHPQVAEQSRLGGAGNDLKAGRVRKALADHAAL